MSHSFFVWYSFSLLNQTHQKGTISQAFCGKFLMSLSASPGPRADGFLNGFISKPYKWLKIAIWVFPKIMVPPNHPF